MELEERSRGRDASAAAWPARDRMIGEQPIDSLEELLDRLCDTSSGNDAINVGQMLAAAGRRSFGVLLLLPGVIVLSPLSGIPGLPTAMAVLIILVALQLLAGRDHFWLPQWILCRRASRNRLQAALRFLRPIARFADKLTRQRLPVLTRGIAVHGVAAACILVALTMPILEIVPFANTTAGAVITIFGLALISRDGLLAASALAILVIGVLFVALRMLS